MSKNEQVKQKQINNKVIAKNMKKSQTSPIFQLNMNKNPQSNLNKKKQNYQINPFSKSNQYKFSSSPKPNHNRKKQLSFLDNFNAITIPQEMLKQFQSPEKNKIGGTFSKAKRENQLNETAAKGVESPGFKYKQYSDFDNKTKGFNIGIGRQEISKSNFSYILMNSNPGPDAYRAERIQSEQGISIGIKTKVPNVNFLNQKLIQNTPGPGSYSRASGIFDKNSKTIYCLSPRFKQNYIQIPGPGKYDPLQIFQNKKGQRSKSNDKRIGFSKSSSIIFGKSSRQSFIDQAIKKNKWTPGPGKYGTKTSDFEMKKVRVCLD